MNYYIEAFRKYAVFEGRSTRSEYWYFFLFNFLVAFVLSFLFGFVGGFFAGFSGASNKGLETLIELPLVAYMFFALVPSLAVGVRRLHDIGLSGWWLLLYFLPFFGGIALIVMYCLDSEAGSNRFGPNPKGVDAPLVVR